MLSEELSVFCRSESMQFLILIYFSYLLLHVTGTPSVVDIWATRRTLKKKRKIKLTSKKFLIFSKKKIFFLIFWHDC